MSFHADAVTLTLLGVIAALIIGILAYMASVRRKASRIKRDAAAICATIIDYFRRSGVDVTVDCTSFDNGLYTAVIESEPMKRFRLSHIIEMTLREHVRRTCGLELDKIYWRFPIKEATQAVTVPREGDVPGTPNAAAPIAEPETDKADESPDDYINEGLENYRHIPKPEVTELPWETFEQVATLGNEKKDPQQ